MIDKWVASQRSRNTQRVYLSGLKRFVKVVIGESEDHADLNQTVERYLGQIKTKRDPFKDLLTYATSLGDSAPKTAGTYIHAIINFLEFSTDIEFSKKQRRQLRSALPRGSKARTIEEDLTMEKLRNILAHCDTKGKALFLFLVSSGIRVGEALQLELDDIKNLDLKNEPVKVNVRGEYSKTRDPYYSFISQEAREALSEWLKVRDEYLEHSKNRGCGLYKAGEGRGVKRANDKRIFPFSFGVAHSMWNSALRKAGLENHDKGTKRRTRHIHMLRKVFHSQLKLVVPGEIVEALMGHEVGLSDAYRRYTEAQIKEWYLKGEPHLYVFVPQEISQIQTKFNSELQDLKEKVNNLLYDNQRLMVQRDDLRMRVEEVSKDLEAVKKYQEYEFKADHEALKELQKWREEFTKRVRKQSKEE